MSATDSPSEPEDWNEMVTIGRVARTHGRRGEVIVNLDTDFPEQRFQPGSVMYSVSTGGVQALRIVEVRFQSGRPVVAFDGFATINDAERLTGRELRMPASVQHPLPDDVYYEHQLVGCEVRTTEGVVVGTVTAVQGAAGANRLIVQSDTHGGEIDIPLAESICVEVDATRKVVVVDPPAGLLDLNRPH